MGFVLLIYPVLLLLLYNGLFESPQAIFAVVFFLMVSFLPAVTLFCQYFPSFRVYNDNICQKYWLLSFCFLYVYLDDALNTLALNPRVLNKYLQLWWSGNLQRVDMDAYFRDFCRDSDHPDQVQYKPVNFWDLRRGWEQIQFRNFWMRWCVPVKSAEDYLDLVCQFEPRDATFDLSCVEDDFFERFIELLPSVTLAPFSRSNKHIYRQCFDVRGIEFGILHSDYRGASWDLEIHRAKNGRLNGFSGKVRFYHKNVSIANSFGTLICKNLNIMDSFHNANRKYGHLIFELFTCSYMNASENSQVILEPTFQEILNAVLHDKVESVKIFFIETWVHPWLHFTTFLPYLDMFKDTLSIKKMGISIHEVEYKHYSIQLLKPPESPGHTFDEAKTAFENWANSMPNLEFFKLIHDYNGFLLHDGKLKLMERLSRRKWFLTEDFSDFNLKNRKNSQNHFLQELECPEFFEPHFYHKCVM